MHVAVVGAGLGGLAAAALLSPHARVTVHERAAHPGGRARSQVEAGATLNLGPHALYNTGAGMSVLRRLGVQPAGSRPPNAGWLARGGRLHELPGATGSMLRTTALTTTEKLRLPAWLYARNVPDVPLAEWLAPAPDGVAGLLQALVRVASYSNAPELLSARAAMRQVSRALSGVLYLDGGWERLVEALVPRAGEVRCGDDVTTLPEADAVVVAGPPALARRLGVPVPELTAVRAACLDLVLDGLPRPEQRFVLGLDAPLYLSEHGSVAKLRGTVLHVARYLAPGDRGADAIGELEALLDLAQPGWRDRVKFRRFLPDLVVSHRVDRPGGVVPGARLVDGRPVHIVGDWVGESGMLADRTFASAEAAADAILRSAGRRAA
jgi:phytoene dehydrogenase-like protein